ncbi:asparaginase [Fluviispira sanaruensis]|uniref:Asparaginase n=1 Tax=Fluviispira sanaruensis TaxID=2493639 RepID=A0A4P2VLE4_FLUSA|nr:asparaginase [Fluviispira sanaruensis]BBH53468.1 asparaginase [Fluviispira sanaruensis]
MKKRVLIYHTGGTFGMALGNAQTVQTQSPDFLKDLLERVPELPSLAQIDLRILCNIDSSDANQKLWSLIANAIQENWDEFDGCVIIHGTDTMAFTATALAFFLQGLTKPIVFTGSQRPLSAMRSDARVNIIDAVELATRGIPEVMVCFDSKIHRAARVTKYSNEHLYAFKSYNAPLVGSLGVNFKIKHKILNSIIPTAKRHMPIINTQTNSNIASLSCVPGALPSEAFIDSLLNSIEGLIIQGFGAGNLPAANKNWLELCKKAFLKKIPVVMSTQCESGSVSLDLYENGRIFANLGVISALDMTFEAASVKLMIMLGRNISFDKRHEFFSTPLAYECTPIFKNKENIGTSK